jgi:hypothetical protein
MEELPRERRLEWWFEAAKKASHKYSGGKSAAVCKVCWKGLGLKSTLLTGRRQVNIVFERSFEKK